MVTPLESLKVIPDDIVSLVCFLICVGARVCVCVQGVRKINWVQITCQEGCCQTSQKNMIVCFVPNATARGTVLQARDHYVSSICEVVKTFLSPPRPIADTASSNFAVLPSYFPSCHSVPLPPLASFSPQLLRLPIYIPTLSYSIAYENGDPGPVAARAPPRENTVGPCRWSQGQITVQQRKWNAPLSK
jgi:hypothetical protein